MLSPVFDAFVEASPVSVMMRVLMENIFNSSRMNVDDIHGIYHGMMIAIPPVHWQCFEDFTLNQLVDILQYL